MAKLKIEGLKELQKALKENVSLDKVKRVVSRNGDELMDKMKSKADFKKGYATGATKESITREFLDDGFTVEVGPTTEYSEYVEYGTRKMEAQPFIRPAQEEQKEIFKKDMQRLVK